MGAAASLRVIKDSRASVDRASLRPVEVEAPPMPDFALHEVLRNLQLSPDTIDKSTAAIYAHVRDPIEHPVDKDLARLCTSDYTRGALHALSWYLVAVSNLQASQEPRLEGDKSTAGSMMLLSPTPPAPRGSAVPASIQHRKAESALLDDNNGNNGDGSQAKPRLVAAEEVGRGTLAENMTDRLATIFNRLRRTRSMPSREQAGVMIDASHRGKGDCHKDDDDFDEDDVDDGRPKYPLSPVSYSTPLPYGSGWAAAQASSSGAPLPKLNVRVSPRSPRSPRSARKSNMLAGLRLGSPSHRGGASATSPRRAPVKTGHWKLGHEIGKGSFGKVHIGLNEDSGDLIAVKMLSLRNADAAEPLYKEIELMRQLTHPNIVSYLGAEVNDGDKTISIFQEWVPGSVTTLLVNFGPFSDRRVASYTKQILHGLLYLHSERVIHRDIKGSNILIDDRGVVKLCDFGASKMLDTEKSFTGLGEHTRVGSPLFMAPEVLLRQEYGPQVDVWSLGGAVLEMATGQPPWQTLNLRTPVALINWIKCTDGPPPLPDGLSQPLKNFLLRCFQREPAKRATVRDLLSDPFVAKRHGDAESKSPVVSEADSVSDIDTLSRTAAIARIRRASRSDSGPRSARSSLTSDAASPRPPSSPSPYAQQLGNKRRAGSPTGGRPRLTSPVECEDTADTGNEGSLAGSTHHPVEEGVEGVIYTAPPTGEEGRGNSPPPRPLSLQTTTKRSSLQVVTSGLDQQQQPCGAGSGPRTLTPPPRRISGGRSNSSSPNPFGGRRRSLEDSPDTPRSPKSGGGGGGAVGGGGTSPRPSTSPRERDQHRGRPHYDSGSTAASDAAADARSERIGSRSSGGGTSPRLSAACVRGGDQHQDRPSFDSGGSTVSNAADARSEGVGRRGSGGGSGGGNADGSDGGGGGEGGGNGRGDSGGGDDASIAVAAAANAHHRVNTKRGGSSASPALKRISSSSSSRRNRSVKDSNSSDRGVAVAAPSSESPSPSVDYDGTRESSQEERPLLKPTRLGRGGRPSSRLGDDNTIDADESGWRWSHK